MLYRGFRYKGEITDHVDGVDGDAFPTPAEVRIAEIAAALGCSESDLEAFETADDPYPQATFVIPPTASPPDPRALKLAALHADPSVPQSVKDLLAELLGP